MRKGSKGLEALKQSRAATGDSIPKELFSQSQFVGMQSELADQHMAFMHRPDTYPELSPLIGDGYSGLHSDCERRMGVLAETVERERATIGILEAKCEEYLSQLQRSADIIEMARDREDRDRNKFEEKLDDLEKRLENERHRRESIEEEKDKIRRQIDRMHEEKDEGEGEVEKVKETLYKRDVTLNDQKVKLQ